MEVTFGIIKWVFSLWLSVTNDTYIVRYVAHIFSINLHR